MFFARMLVDMLRRRLRVRTFFLQFKCALRFGGENVFAAVHARHLVEMVREAEVAALCVLHDSRAFERVMRPAIAGMTLRMAHAD